MAGEAGACDLLDVGPQVDVEDDDEDDKFSSESDKGVVDPGDPMEHP